MVGLLAFTMVIPACIKEYGFGELCQRTTGKDAWKLSLSKPIVKKGEPFTVTTNAPDPSTVIKWAIRPSYSTVLIPYGNELFVSISVAGTYLLTADFYTPADTIIAYDRIYALHNYCE